MRLQDLNWMDVDRYLQIDSRIILVTGAAQQNAYLSLLTDVLIPQRIADAVSERTHVLSAPPLNFGVSPLFGEFPGTISLSRHTFEFVVMEIVESLFHQGFRRFVVVNGHEGNKIPARLEDFQMEGVLRILWYDWQRSPAVQAFEAQHDLRVDHGNWSENFPFTRVAELPAGVKPPVNLAFLEERHYSQRAVLGDGSFGGPYQVDDALMQELFGRVVDEVVGLVESLRE